MNDSRNIKNLALLGLTFVILGAVSGTLANKNGFRLHDYIPDSQDFEAHITSIEKYTSEKYQAISMPNFSGITEVPSHINRRIRAIEWPELGMPDITWPEIKIPEIKIPEIEFPEISWPEFKMPDMEMPEIDMPEFNIGTQISGMAAKSRQWFAAIELTSLSLPDSKPALEALAALEPQAGTPAAEDIPAKSGLGQVSVKSVKTEVETETKTATDHELSQEPDSAVNDNFKYDLEEDSIEVEGVLVPKRATIISSSRDGKIAKINFDNGDIFRAGDVLIEYECGDVKAELEVAEAEKEFSQKRTMRNEKLLKLDIISDIEHLGIKTEDIKASAQAKIIENRMEQCYIRAAYDGRVTNRLANEHEYTRSDRVLMEVGSLENLEIEFLLPSKWLRWINVDAPVTLEISETQEQYKAKIQRIYGEVDPVSQSIQMSAELEPYQTPLLPGMSGTITIDINAVREAGIKGFLETPRLSSPTNLPVNP